MRGIPVLDTCKFCNAMSETNLHLFFECTDINIIWKYLKLKAGLACSKLNSGLEWESLYKETRWRSEYSYELLLILKVLQQVFGRKEMRESLTQKASNYCK